MDNWIKKQAQLAPDRSAVTDGEKQLTFAELYKKVSELSAKLNYLNPLKNQRIAILTTNSMDGYLTALAVLNAGNTIVWLNRRLSPAELNYQLADSKVETCLYEDQLNVTQLNCQTVSFTKLFNASKKTFTPSDEFALDAPASIMYTSGTTGKPKGVIQTFGNHFSSATASALNLGLLPGNEWLCVVPIFHISGFSIMMRGLIYGMTVRLASHFDPQEINDMLVTEPVTMISVVPYMLKQLLTIRQTTGESYQAKFRGMLLGGGPIDRLTLRHCSQLNIPVVQSYGMTETCSQIVALSFADAPTHIGSSGKPLFLTQLRIAANTHEIEVKTPALSHTYLGQPEKYAEKLTPDGWFKTGDVGRLDQDGFLYVDGRSDDMIISGGENIFPDEVEAAYADCPLIDNIAVIGVEDKKWGEKPVAFFIPKSNHVSSQKLNLYGRKHLAHYKVPKSFYEVSELPRNAGGKLQRFKLKKLVADSVPIQ